MFPVPKELDSSLAQVVERLSCMRKVLGLNPGVGNIFISQILIVYVFSVYLGLYLN